MKLLVSKLALSATLSVALFGQTAEGGFPVIRVERPIRGQNRPTIALRTAETVVAVALADVPLHVPAAQVAVLADASDADKPVVPIVPQLPVVIAAAPPAAPRMLDPIRLRFDSAPGDRPLTSEAYRMLAVGSAIRGRFIRCIDNVDRSSFKPTWVDRVYTVWEHVKRNISGVAQAGLARLYRHSWNSYHFLDPAAIIEAGMFSAGADRQSIFYFDGGRTGYGQGGRGCQGSYLALLASFSRITDIAVEVNGDGSEISFVCFVETGVHFPRGRAIRGTTFDQAETRNTLRLIIKQPVRIGAYVGRAPDGYFNYTAIASKLPIFASLY